MLLRERNIDAIVGRSGLQLEVEPAAETFAQRKSPALIDPATEGCVEDQLHPSAFIEEPLGDDGALGRNGSQNGPTCNDVVDQLHGAGCTDTIVSREQC